MGGKSSKRNEAEIPTNIQNNNENNNNEQQQHDNSNSSNPSSAVTATATARSRLNLFFNPKNKVKKSRQIKQITVESRSVDGIDQSTLQNDSSKYPKLPPGKLKSKQLESFVFYRTSKDLPRYHDDAIENNENGDIFHTDEALPKFTNIKSPYKYRNNLNNNTLNSMTSSDDNSILLSGKTASTMSHESSFNSLIISPTFRQSETTTPTYQPTLDCQGGFGSFHSGVNSSAQSIQLPNRSGHDLNANGTESNDVMTKAERKRSLKQEHDENFRQSLLRVQIISKMQQQQQQQQQQQPVSGRRSRANSDLGQYHY